MVKFFCGKFLTELLMPGQKYINLLNQIFCYLKNTHAICVTKNLVCFSIVTVSDIGSRDK